MAEIIRRPSPPGPTEALRAAGRLLKAGQLAAVCQAEELLAAAQQQAEQLRAQAAAEAAQQAAAILAATQQQAADRLAAISAAELERWAALLMNTETALAALQPELEQRLLELTLLMTRKIIGEELRADKAAVLRLVREALSGLRRQRQLEITVHPQYAELLRARIQELKNYAKGTPAIEILADPAVGPEGCRIICDWGEIDARLETQLEALRQALSLTNQSWRPSSTTGNIT